jgi:hypothetical protein
MPSLGRPSRQIFVRNPAGLFPNRFAQLDIAAIEVTLLNVVVFVPVDQDIANLADLPVGVLPQIGHVIVGLEETIGRIGLRRAR